MGLNKDQILSIPFLREQKEKNEDIAKILGVSKGTVMRWARYLREEEGYDVPKKKAGRKKIMS